MKDDIKSDKKTYMIRTYSEATFTEKEYTLKEKKVDEDGMLTFVDKDGNEMKKCHGCFKAKEYDEEDEYNETNTTKRCSTN